MHPLMIFFATLGGMSAGGVASFTSVTDFGSSTIGALPVSRNHQYTIPAMITTRTRVIRLRRTTRCRHLLAGVATSLTTGLGSDGLEAGTILGTAEDAAGALSVAEATGFSGIEGD
jgi:hypothetical protein